MGNHPKHTQYDLRQMQSLPLSAKIKMTERRIQEWYDAFDGQVYVSFSGGKDSTVLLDIARRLYPDIEAVFVDTGLEYPSVRRFALSKDKVTVLKPKMLFRDIVIKYGYPIIGKEVCKKAREAKRGSEIAKRHFDGSMKNKSYFDFSRYNFLLFAPFNVSEKCCDEMKKKPLKDMKNPMTAMLAEESLLRQKNWRKFGCNAFDMERPKSSPMSFWTENDVLTYIHENGLEIAEAYGKVIPKNDGIDGQTNIYDYLGDYTGCQFCTTGCKRTGCIFCLFGITQDLGRIQNLQKQEPALADYVLRGGEFGEDGMWRPSKTGMGYWFVLDWLALHGIVVPHENADHYMDTYGNEKTKEILNKK